VSAGAFRRRCSPSGTRGLFSFPFSLGERRTRSASPARTASEGRSLFPESVAGVADPGPQIPPVRLGPAAATTSARYWACWVASPIIILFVVSCASFAPPPEISPALVANARPDHADANMLATGRKLFVSRCLECHTLPSVTKHSREEWPHFVSRMSGRANLSVDEEAAIVAYLRAASLANH
jgi:mono/diheme cytochrome c family protein